MRRHRTSGASAISPRCCSSARRRPQPQAQTAWSPQKSVEFIVPTAAGSSMDVLARLIQDLWQRNQLVTATMTVQPRPGGGGALAWSYVSQRVGDGHYLAISGPTLLANDVLKIGNLRYQDVTPIAQLFTEYGAFAVNANSTIKTGKDLALALAGPKPPSVAIAPGQGSSSHVALLAARARRRDRSRQADDRAVQGRERIGDRGAGRSRRRRHRDHVGARSASGRGKVARRLRIAAPQRLSGQHANIPTWKEQGLDVVEGNWRGVVGPKNLGTQQVAFWSGRLAEIVKKDEWQASLVRNSWDADFRIGADAQNFLDTQYQELASTLAVLRTDK